eukprot:jgi/Chlat1/985/Chrsp108S01413
MAQRARALQLYRALFRAAERMPTQNRRDYIRKKVRVEYSKAREESDPEQVEFLLRLAAVQLETVQIQATHLIELAKLDLTRIKGVPTSVL